MRPVAQVRSDAPPDMIESRLDPANSALSPYRDACIQTAHYSAPDGEKVFRARNDRRK